MTTEKPTPPEGYELVVDDQQVRGSRVPEGSFEWNGGAWDNTDPHDFVVHPSSGHPIFYAIPKARMAGLVPWTFVAPVPEIPARPTDHGQHVAAHITATSALDTQVGGAHYKQFAIQPADFIIRNNLGYAEGAVIKYVCRHGQKNGAEDLDKAIHYLQILKEMKYGRKS